MKIQKIIIDFVHINMSMNYWAYIPYFCETLVNTGFLVLMQWYNYT